jgi:hypothetical protein
MPALRLIVSNGWQKETPGEVGPEQAGHPHFCLSPLLTLHAKDLL